ncbi:hypothetical protein GCM10023321_50570 [Pseudonocardia eucalypti]|uniref:Uncharacterized protein n=1 Tax=Pseudonocardia eucalypti TaxID=648755 RepID=A0ABP9QKU2_9PSEU
MDPPPGGTVVLDTTVPSTLVGDADEPTPSSPVVEIFAWTVCDPLSSAPACFGVAPVAGPPAGGDPAAGEPTGPPVRPTEPRVPMPGPASASFEPGRPAEGGLLPGSWLVPGEPAEGWLAPAGPPGPPAAVASAGRWPAAAPTCPGPPTCPPPTGPAPATGVAAGLPAASRPAGLLDAGCWAGPTGSWVGSLTACRDAGSLTEPRLTGSPTDLGSTAGLPPVPVTGS